MSIFCCCLLRSMGFQCFLRHKKQPDKLLSGCCVFIFCCTFLLYKTSYRYNCSVCSIIADLDPVLRVRCMNDLAITHVNSHVSAIADQISRLCICVGYFCTCILLLIGCSRKADSEVRIDTLYKSGAPVWKEAPRWRPLPSFKSPQETQTAPHPSKSASTYKHT